MISDPYGLHRVFQDNDFLVFDTSGLKYENMNKRESYELVELRKKVKTFASESGILHSQINYLERITNLILSTPKVKIPKIVYDETKQGCPKLRTGIFYQYRLSIERFLDVCEKRDVLIYPDKDDLALLLGQAKSIGIKERDCKVIASATRLEGRVALISNDMSIIRVLLTKMHKQHIKPYSPLREESIVLVEKPFLI